MPMINDAPATTGGRLRAAVVGLLMALLVGGCVTVDPEPVTSPDWVVSVCDALDRYMVAGTADLAKMADALSTNESALALGNDGIYEPMVESTRELLAQVKAVGPRVPPEDKPVHDFFLVLAETFLEIHQRSLDAFRVLEQALADPQAGDTDYESRLVRVFANLQETTEEREHLLESLATQKFETALPETRTNFEECELQSPPGFNCEDGDCPEFEVATPSAGVPWVLETVDDLRISADGLEEILVTTDDLRGDTLRDETFVEPGDGLIGYAKESLGTGCPGAGGNVAPLPGHGMADRWAGNLLTSTEDPGMLIVVVEHYADVTEAGRLATSIEAALERCDNPLDPDPLVLGTAVSFGGANLFTAGSEFGDLIDDAPPGEMRMVWLHSGPYVAMVMTDAYGIGAGGMDAVVGVVKSRLASAAGT